MIMTVPVEDTLAYYRYDLPEELIAQEPLARGESRLLVLNRRTGTREHRFFRDLPDLLPEGALLSANNSRVLPVRIPGTRPTGGKSECLLLSPAPLLEQAAAESEGRFRAKAEVLLKPSRAVHEGDCLFFPDEREGALRVRVLAKGDFGRHDVWLEWSGGRSGLTSFLQRFGKLPLPPYIHRESRPSDADTYQTVYSRADKAGSAAAPTAGLHFTDAMRSRLRERGFGWAEVTLHVGYGTFSPVRCADIREHVMHSEFIDCPRETAEAIRAAKAEGRPVIAVGTTACRTLEGIAQKCGSVEPFAGWTNIFIRPGYTFRAIDGMITNFHLPESTLLMLVCALAGHDAVLAAYNDAVKERYRFFSYGDAMLIR